jgi:cell division septum initiation protein DivIVA
MKPGRIHSATCFLPLLPLAAAVLFAGLGTGCRLVRGVAEVPGQAVRTVTPGQKDKNAVDPVEAQEQLLRFADAFSARLMVSIDQLRRGTNAIDRAEQLQWKIAFGTETVSIVSGPNAIGNLLDMTVFVTVTRAAVEEHWQPKIFGESARSLLEGCQNAETNIWRLTSRILAPSHQAELRKAIEAWRRLNPQLGSVLAARAVGFSSQVAEASKGAEAKPDSVFSLLGVDPLAGMDPAVREIARTRLFAERALFVTQRMPMLLRWQAELLSLNAMAMPEVQQLATNTTQIAASVERFSRVAEQLPKQVSTEREEILKAIESQEKGLAALAGEFRQTLTAGTQMSTSLNVTLTTFDALMKRFGVGETNNAAPPATNAEPFRIQDYTATAAQLEATARQLTELLSTLDRTVSATNLAKISAQVAPAVQQAQAGGKEIVNYAFWKGVLLVVVVLLAALIYRFLATRMARSTPINLQ